MARPADAPRVDAALQRVAAMPVEAYLDHAALDDAAIEAKLERAGFRRAAGAERATRDRLEEAYADAYGACSVCLAPFETGDACRRVDPCGHVFHVACLDGWLAACAAQTRVPSCPQCTSAF